MKYRKQLPQLQNQVCLTDGGLETVLIFQKGMDLPEFAAFTLLDRPDGEETFTTYLDDYIEIARKHEFGLLLESPTWRSNSDWGQKLGYDDKALDAIDQKAIGVLERIRRERETGTSPMPISGCIGPRGDGYSPSAMMSVTEATNYHRRQVRAFGESAADLITGLTMTYADEAIGLTQAAQSAEIPIAISFTVETDGRLPSGERLAAAIEHCDAETNGYASYFMINCAHPTHFRETVEQLGDAALRLGGVRANASKMSHEELDNAEQLDRGCAEELASDMMDLRGLAPHLNVVGGCCGTDHEHIAQMAASLREETADR